MLSEVKEFTLEELKAIDNLIIDLAKNRLELISDITQHLILAGGKRLRAILTILGAKIFAYEGSSHIRLAAAVEAIHSATLLHDDVIDESSLRRQLPTVNALWGNKPSILAGDFLFSQAFELMVADGSLEVLGLLSKASAIISEGELHQLSALGRMDLSEEEYFKIITAKTAELFAASCEIGSIITQQNDFVRQNMRHLGLELGIAFQIMDDALDYSANQAEMGKNPGDDFYEGKLTLPVIHCLAKADITDHQLIRSMFQVDNKDSANSIRIGELVAMQDLLKKYGSIEYSIAVAKKYAHSAQERIKDIDNPAAKHLRSLIAFAVERSF